jgi:ribonuclease HI
MGVYRIYTDGSCKGTNVGGWAYVITSADDIELGQGSGREEATTNNRMELQACIEALKRFDPKTSEVTVLCDSAYVVNCFLQKWYVKWEKNDWQGSQGPVKNRDQWEELLGLCRTFKYPPTWQHIKGHNGNKWNEFADSLATKEAAK